MGYTLLLQILSLPLLFQSFAPTEACDEAFGEKWTPSWAPESRNDLRCQISDRCTRGHAISDRIKFDKCCACHSCAIWEGTEKDLFIEYESVIGRSLIVGDQAPTNPDDVYKIHHTNSYLTEIPSNLCNWDTDADLNERFPQQFKIVQLFWKSIVGINFENNKISKIRNLNCLVRLDYLNLRNNRLTFVSNTSFNTLTSLRSVDFSGNRIQEIDPRILTSVHLSNLYYANFRGNNMTEVDVSNMLSLHPFCHIDFKQNRISTLVNKDNFTLNMTKTYGPGFVHFSENEFAKWPDFKELFHLDELSQVGHLLNFAFDFVAIPIICDCHLQPFMSLADDIIDVLWPAYKNLKCYGPAELAGTSINYVSLDRFICNITADSGCPTPHCNCTDKPYDNLLSIDCPYNHGSKLDHLPTIPTSNYSHTISLNFSGHHLTSIAELSTFSNISVLDVSNNDILEFSNGLAKALEDASFVDISNNVNLHRLPKLFLQYRNVCATNMKDLVIDCNCESTWIETWLHSKSCINEEYLFQCNIPDGKRLPALSFRAADIDCSDDSDHTLEYKLSGTIVFLLLSGILIYTFRYELLILFVRMKQHGRNSAALKYKYDVFLSFNDTDENVQKWVHHKLEDNLVNAGYKVFQPNRDVPFGTERDTEVLSTINNTRNFVIILTDNYLSQVEDGIRSWTENEWKYGWYNFIRHSSKNIVLIDFDYVSSFDVLHPQIKAFLRVGCTVDFKNHDRNIMENIYKKLGKPSIPLLNQKADENRKPKFWPLELLVSNQNNYNGMYEEGNTDQDTGHLKVLSPNINSRFKKKNRSAVAVATKTFTLPREKKTEYQYDKENTQSRQHFSGDHGDRNLKKTPHIPLFKKQKHSTKSNEKSTTSTRECIEESPENYSPCHKTDEYKSKYWDEFAKVPATKCLKTSKDNLTCASTAPENFEGVDPEEKLFWFKMSKKVCKSQASLSTITGDLESISGSEYSNTLSTSVGSSRTSFQISLGTGSMTDVSV